MRASLVLICLCDLNYFKLLRLLKLLLWGAFYSQFKSTVDAWTTGLNCMGPFIHNFFPNKYMVSLLSPWGFASADSVNCRSKTVFWYLVGRWEPQHGPTLLSSAILCRDLSIPGFWCPQEVLEPHPAPHGCLRTNMLLESQSIYGFSTLGKGGVGVGIPTPHVIQELSVCLCFIFEGNVLNNLF